MWPALPKRLTVQYFEILRNDRFKYFVCWNLPMVEATSTKFSCFTLVSYLQERPLYKNQAAKSLAILDRFLLGVDCIRQIPTWVPIRQARWWFEFFTRKVKGCIRPLYGPFRSLYWLIWRKIYSRHINTAEPSSHSQPSPD